MQLLKSIFIPHSGNDHYPYILRETGVLVVVCVAMFVFVLSGIHSRFLVSNLFSTAAVLPAVLVDLTNNERAALNVHTLRENPILTRAAELKAHHMASQGYFAHYAPDGTTPWHWMREAGYDFIYAGENLAVNFFDSEDIAKAWMNSPTHRANIVHPVFTDIGIATARGVYKGRETVFVVQMFGRAERLDTALIPLRASAALSRRSTNTSSIAQVENNMDSDTGMYEEGVPAEQSFLVVEQLPDGSVRTIEGVEGDRQTTYFGRIFSHPHSVYGTLLLIVGGLVLMSLLLHIAVRYKAHHFDGFVYGVLLLILIAGIYVLHQVLLYPEVEVLGSTLL